MKQIVVSGGFDNIKSRAVRFLEEAAKFGPVHVLLWSDDALRNRSGVDPKFPQKERQYFLEAVRFVHQVRLVEVAADVDELPKAAGLNPSMWAVTAEDDTPQKQQFCARKDIDYQVIAERDLQGFPISASDPASSAKSPKVLVTGCYDWFHSGHVRFFEETSALGDLYVVVGHDENVRLLKGEGHPLFPAEERRYLVGAIRFVRQALISSGSGWMDAAPEIEAVGPDIYAVNEDGDKPEKRAFCRQQDLRYVVLKRKPAAGLPHRESTHLRGF